MYTKSIQKLRFLSYISQNYIITAFKGNLTLCLFVRNLLFQFKPWLHFCGLLELALLPPIEQKRDPNAKCAQIIGGDPYKRRVII